MAADMRAFDQYLEDQQALLTRLFSEQAAATRSGLVADPKSEPHGGFRVACTWSPAITHRAWELSQQIAALVPGAPAYPYDSIHSSIGNLAAAGNRLVDPSRVPGDKKLLDALSRAVESVVEGAEVTPEGRRSQFGPALLVPRMALIFSRSGTVFWKLSAEILAACASADIEMVPSWGPHLTLTRFAEPVQAARIEPLLRLLRSWPLGVEAEMAEIMVGYYTVGDGDFRVTAYRSFPLNLIR